MLLVGSGYPYEQPQWDGPCWLASTPRGPIGVFSAIGSAVLVKALCALLVRLPWLRWALHRFVLPVR